MVKNRQTAERKFFAPLACRAGSPVAERGFRDAGRPLAVVRASRGAYEARTAAKTSSAWPSTFTLSHTRAIRPSGPISTVLRVIP